jgi:hypothetical protein
MDKVVLLGRTMAEYQLCFDFNLSEFAGKRILDVAARVSSFTAEANEKGAQVTAVDPIYSFSSQEITERCQPDLEAVIAAIGAVSTYRWSFYKNPETMRAYRERAWRGFIADYASARADRYIAATLPRLPLPDKSFDLSLICYFLFVYEEQFSYEFHRDALRELLRVTRGEIRIYPLVTFEAEPSSYLERLRNEPEFANKTFEIVPTQFEFLANSNSFLRVT